MSKLLTFDLPVAQQSSLLFHNRKCSIIMSCGETFVEELRKHPGDKNTYRMTEIADDITAVLVSSPGMRASGASILFNTGWFDDPVSAFPRSTPSQRSPILTPTERIQWLSSSNGTLRRKVHRCTAGSRERFKRRTREFQSGARSSRLANIHGQTHEFCAKYISRHGGDLHGEVSGECSVYSFYTASAAFEPALKTFGKAVFHAPSIEPEIVGREILSLNAEFHKNRRLNGECLRSLNMYLSQPGSRIFHRFTDGDYSSLTDYFAGRRQDTCPSHPFHPADRDLWESVRARIMEWWSSFYPPSQKYLVVVGPGMSIVMIISSHRLTALLESIAELVELVNRSFVANRSPSRQTIQTVMAVPQLQSPWGREQEQVRRFSLTPSHRNGLY